MSVHPHRQAFESDVAFWRACSDALDALWPDRAAVRERVAAWERMRATDPAETIARMRELLTLDEWTDAEAAEFDTLTDLYRAHRANARTAQR